VASIFVGLVDTIGRAFLTRPVAAVSEHQRRLDAGPSLSSMMIYMLMAAILSPAGRSFPASADDRWLTPRNAAAAGVLALSPLLPVYAR